MKLKQFVMNLQVGQKFDAQFLDRHLVEIFPDLAFVENHIKMLQSVKKADLLSADKRITSEDFLPYFVRDDDWLEVYLGSKFKIQNLSYETIRKYIAYSPKFAAARDQYEENIVRCYLNEYKNFKSDDFYADMETKYFLRNSINYDKVFRHEVKSAMNKLGLSAKSIEYALEKNAALWRDEVMTVAFLNRYPDCGIRDYVRHGYRFEDGLIEEQDSKPNFYAERAWCLLPLSKLSEQQKSLYNIWKSLREFEYYQENKKTIDKLGLATPNMKMNTKDALSLFSKLQALEYICGYKRNQQKQDECKTN